MGVFQLVDTLAVALQVPAPDRLVVGAADDETAARVEEHTLDPVAVTLLRQQVTKSINVTEFEVPNSYGLDASHAAV